MLKNYLKEEIIHPDNEDAIEELWASKLLSSIGEANSQDIKDRIEYKAIAPILEKLDYNAQILDGGCGRGEWTTSLTQMGYAVQGVDISSKLIDALQKIYPNSSFFKGNVIDLINIDSESIDLYFSWGVFEHFEIGISPCLEEARRVLKVGGKLVFTVPFANKRQLGRYDKQLKKGFINSQFNLKDSERLAFYQWRFTAGELYRELARHGFKIHRISPIDKDEGIRRMLRSNLKITLRPGSILETLFLKALRPIMTPEYLGHMILAIVEK